MKFDDHFLSWTLIYAILIYLTNFLFSIFNIGNYFFILLFAGFVITLGSWIFYSIIYKNRFRLNGWFIIWTFTHALSYWLITLLLSLFTIQIQFIYYLFFGLLFHLLTWVIKYRIYNKFNVKHRRNKLILTFLILIGLLFFVSSFFIPNSSSLQTTNQSASFIDDLKNIFSQISLGSGNCPQIDTPILSDSELGDYITQMNFSDGKTTVTPLYNGWKISVYNFADMFGMKTDFVFCHIGVSEGENPNYFYCDSGGLAGGIPYISKTQTSPDGTIGKTTKKSFVNIYDKNRKFVKTICGDNPENIAEENFKSKMRELDNAFSLN